MKVAADAEKLRREGVDVVDFSAGEPDFPTPANVKRAAIDAIDHNFTKYTNAAGTLELKQAICDRHKIDYQTAYAANECVVTVGGKLGFIRHEFDSRRRTGRDQARLHGLTIASPHRF